MLYMVSITIRAFVKELTLHIRIFLEAHPKNEWSEDTCYI